MRLDVHYGSETRLDRLRDGEKVSSRRRPHVAPGLFCGTRTLYPSGRRGRVHAQDSRSVASCQDVGLVARGEMPRRCPYRSAVPWRSGRGGSHMSLAPDPTTSTALIGEGLVETPGVPAAGTPPKEIRGRSLGQIAWSRLKRDKAAMAGGVVVILLILVAIFAPLIVALLGHDPDEFHQDAALLDLNRGGVPKGTFGGMSRDFLFGLEPENGRDLFSRVIYGSRVSLLVAFLAALLPVVV